MVEDDPDSCALTSMVLARRGYSVDSVGSGREALAALAESSYDVVLLDLGLPDMSGLDVAVEMRAQRVGSCPFLVALTGRDSSVDRQHMVRAGFDAHLAKPASSTDLVDAIERARALRRPD